MGIAPYALEARVLRLGWWQQIFRDRECNAALPGIFFGRLGFEAEGQLGGSGKPDRSCHPWPKQLERDMMSAGEVDGGEEFLERWQGNFMLLVSGDEMREMCCGLDVFPAEDVRLEG